MVKSMTGFGRGEAASVDYKITIEVKSINNRYLEVIPRMPRQIVALEDPVKKFVNGYVQRGRVDVFVTLEETENRQKTLKTDKELALAYYKSMQEIAELCNMDNAVTMDNMVRMPGIFTMEKDDDDLDEIWKLMQEALGSAMNLLVEMRQTEGDKLAADLLQRCAVIVDFVKEIDERSPMVVAEYQEKLQNRITELLADTALLDEAKFANEVAYFADRASITEELIRLDSHLSQLKDLLSCNDVVGRKLDFLMQELNREINTIGSKANDLQISRRVIDVKSELEKIREQVQNIE
ncbi:MAG: YicC/YloC family endoribonuclease [Bacillota bacterium]